jgi:uncharacterized protein (DUF488 family)
LTDSGDKVIVLRFDWYKFYEIPQTQVMTTQKIWTIGHSTHSMDDFLALLKSHQIQAVADIRRFPGSRRLPHFNLENLHESLTQSGISYHHFEKLGGRRTPRPDSRNSGWRVMAFRGYADYMETDEFKRAAEELQQLAKQQRVVFMCSEAVWWSCHRALVSDFLKHNGWTVLHIMSVSKADEHPWTKPARIADGKLVYYPHNLLEL